MAEEQNSDESPIAESSPKPDRKGITVNIPRWEDVSGPKGKDKVLGCIIYRRIRRKRRSPLKRKL